MLYMAEHFDELDEPILPAEGQVEDNNGEEQEQEEALVLAPKAAFQPDIDELKVKLNARDEKI